MAEKNNEKYPPKVVPPGIPEHGANQSISVHYSKAMASQVPDLPIFYPVRSSNKFIIALVIHNKHLYTTSWPLHATTAAWVQSFRHTILPDPRILTDLTVSYIPSPHLVRPPNQPPSLPCFPKAATAPPTQK